MVGTPFELRYQSARSAGFKERYTVRVPLTGASVPSNIERIELDGRTWVRKQRLAVAPALLWVGRGYARALTVPVEFLDLAAWQRWECALHGAGASVDAAPPRG